MIKVKDDASNLTKCICVGCPTYQSDACAKERLEGLYCARGKTSCQLVAKGCHCSTCPVYQENAFTSGYFCTRGAAGA
jgi:hypothetical protein